MILVVLYIRGLLAQKVRPKLTPVIMIFPLVKYLSEQVYCAFKVLNAITCILILLQMQCYH